LANHELEDCIGKDGKKKGASFDAPYRKNLGRKYYQLNRAIFISPQSAGFVLFHCS